MLQITVQPRYLATVGQIQNFGERRDTGPSYQQPWAKTKFHRFCHDKLKSNLNYCMLCDKYLYDLISFRVKCNPGLYV